MTLGRFSKCCACLNPERQAVQNLKFQTLKVAGGRVDKVPQSRKSCNSVGPQCWVTLSAFFSLQLAEVLFNLID